MWIRRTRRGALFVVALLMGACDDATGPDTTDAFDAQAALQDYQALEQILASDAFAGFRSLDGRTPFSTPAAVQLVGALADDDPRAFAFDLLRRARAPRVAGSVAGAPLISDFTRGSTFVYDPARDGYAIDPDRGGAPATGVRFILYQVDGGGTPIVDREIGHADLVDEGDGVEGIALRLEVVSEGRTHLDYRTTLSSSGSQGTLTVAGFVLGDGADRLDFDIRADGREANGREELDLAFDLAVANRDFHIDGSVRGISEGNDDGGDLDVSVRHGPDSFRLSASVEDETIDGTVRLNGDVFALASGASDDPTFTKPDGRALSGIELLVLVSIVDAVEDVFDFLEDLVDPVDNLVILGILL
jgi:hypothetical protein